MLKTVNGDLSNNTTTNASHTDALYVSQGCDCDIVINIMSKSATISKVAITSLESLFLSKDTKPFSKDIIITGRKNVTYGHTGN